MVERERVPCATNTNKELDGRGEAARDKAFICSGPPGPLRKPVALRIRPLLPSPPPPPQPPQALLSRPLASSRAQRIPSFFAFCSCPPSPSHAHYLPHFPLFISLAPSLSTPRLFVCLWTMLLYIRGHALREGFKRNRSLRTYLSDKFIHVYNCLESYS